MSAYNPNIVIRMKKIRFAKVWAEFLWCRTDEKASFILHHFLSNPFFLEFWIWTTSRIFLWFYDFFLIIPLFLANRIFFHPDNGVQIMSWSEQISLVILAICRKWMDRGKSSKKSIKCVLCLEHIFIIFRSINRCFFLVFFFILFWFVFFFS